MKALPKRKGNARLSRRTAAVSASLNESPSEKEGKCPLVAVETLARALCLNESPSEKEGKWGRKNSVRPSAAGLNESPSEKEGKCGAARGAGGCLVASMKALPKRKGNNDRKSTVILSQELPQ